MERSFSLKFNGDKDKWRELLSPFKVIRDAVHGDIWITELETKVIDESIFQKLRHKRQLGPTYLVYPTAHHTRFEHCLGTLFMSQRIVDAVQMNYVNREIVLGSLLDGNIQPFSLDSRDISLIRLASLLHDAIQIPFEHTLKDEGNLLKKTQWADEARVNYFFDECQMKQKITSYIETLVGKAEAEKFVEELKNVLQAIEGVDPKTKKLIESEIPEDEAISKLPHPYVGDIVGNTICADLLDYVLRDSYFTGLKLSTELRIINNFMVMGRSKEDARLTLLLVRKGRLREDILSGTVELLRQRYFLAERVYYHRVKASASAMLISAFYSYLKFLTNSLGEYKEVIRELLNIGDDALVDKIDQDINKTEQSVDIQIARKLIRDFKNRRLYKPVYMLRTRIVGRDAVKLESLVEKYTIPEERYKFERYLENLLSLKPGSIVIYVTKKDLGKAARTRCLWIDGSIKPLEEISQKPLLQEELINLKNKYQDLWRLYVFIDKELIEQYGVFVAGFCKRKLFEINDVEDETFAKATPKDEGEIFLDLCTQTALTPMQRSQFLRKVESLRMAQKDHSELGVPKSELEKLFSDMTLKS